MNKRSSAPTLQDVARMAKVSTATVSRCFNTPDKVIETTRDRVLEIVEEFGYTPHFGGRTLASNRSNTVGAIIPTIDNAIFARGIQAFQETLAQNNVTLLIASSGYDPEREFQQIRSLISQGADGLLLIGHARPIKTYDFLQRRQIPYVVTWNYREDSNSFNVGFDNRKAGSKITNEILKFGHKRIAVITGHTEFNDRALDRLNGVRDAMKSSGISELNLAIISTTYSLKSGADAFEDFMTRKPRPTVIMCGNDVLATGAITRANEMGIKVPYDVSVTGFDDIDLAEVVQPKLTTVHVPHRRMGKSSAKLLLDILNGKQDCQSLELEIEIVLRQSLGNAF
jgi:LacI family transcriptional regulator